MATSIPQLWLGRRTSLGLALLVALLLVLVPARAQTAEEATEAVELQLEVRVKGYPLNLIAAFTQFPDGELASPRSELVELGIEPSSDGAPDDLIRLRDVPGLSYVYDESSQSIDLELPDSSRIARSISTGKGDMLEPTPSGMGLVLNYDASIAAGYDIPDSATAFDGASLTLDARAFSKFGTLRQSGTIASRNFSQVEAVRLDTTFTHSDHRRTLEYNVGDIISGNLRWNRAVRLGGGQIRRNFGLRPDLITVPLPEFQGTAAVPSTLDIYVGQTQAYSGSVEPGPFVVNDLPVINADGNATMVLTDANGNRIETETEFYYSPHLLKQGLVDFSVEGGVVRRDYGTESFGYGDEPVGLASLRYGLTNLITAEAHVEGKSDLLNGGLGAVFSAKKLGTFSIAAAGSLSGDDEGAYLFAGWEGTFGNFTASASMARAFGDYLDLAAATEVRPPGQPFVSKIPSALEQVSLAYEFPQYDSGIALNFVHSNPAVGHDTYLVSAGYNQTFARDITLFVNGFKNFGKKGGYGGYLGVTIPLGKDITTKSGVMVTDKSWSAGAEASRAPDPDKGGIGWSVGHTEAKDGNRATTARGLYYSPYGQARGEVAGNQDEIAGAAGFQGAAVLAGGGVMLSAPIDDAFAIVDTGAPDIPVKFENRVIGKSGKNGKLLLPNLRSYQQNKVSLDVDELPPEMAAGETEFVVVPRDGAGVVVDFGLKADARNFSVLVTDATGQPVTEGTEVLLEGSDETFFAGYDGLVYLTDLNDQNRIIVKLPDRDCAIEFAITSDLDPYQDLGPFQCS